MFVQAPVYLREYARVHFTGTKALQTKVHVTTRPPQNTLSSLPLLLCLDQLSGLLRELEMLDFKILSLWLEIGLLSLSNFNFNYNFSFKTRWKRDHRDQTIIVPHSVLLFFSYLSLS